MQKYNHQPLTGLRTLFICVIMFAATSAWCQLSGKVVSVLDGDTFILLTASNRQVRIRLHGIDCPEKNQPFGQVAKKFASNAIFGKTVRVDSLDTDRYGRTIGMVWYDEPTKNLNEELLKAGVAWHYKRYDQNPKWAKLEQDAKDAKIGLWQSNSALAPWDWRN